MYRIGLGRSSEIILETMECNGIPKIVLGRLNYLKWDICVYFGYYNHTRFLESITATHQQLFKPKMGCIVSLIVSEYLLEIVYLFPLF